MINILLTGSSRGIGAAIATALQRRGRHAGRDTAPAPGWRRTSPTPPRLGGCGTPRWNSSDGHLDVLINNAGVFEASPLGADHDDWVASWERTMRVNLTAAAELSRLAVLHWQASRRWPLGQHRQPRGLSRGLAPALALRRRQGGDGGDDQDDRQRIRAGRHPRVRGPARVHDDGHGGRVSDLARRGQAARRHPAWAGG